MEEYKYELAQKFCQRALELDSDHPRALELTGNLLLELGEVHLLLPLRLLLPPVRLRRHSSASAEP